MKKSLQFILLVIGCCFIHSVLFAQDSTNKVYQIKFSGYESVLSKEAKAILNEISAVMKNRPGRNFKIISCQGTENEKFNMANWNRVNKTVTYLVEKKGISGNRLVFTYGEKIDCNTLYLQGTDEKITTD